MVLQYVGYVIFACIVYVEKIPSFCGVVNAQNVNCQLSIFVYTYAHG